MAITRDVKAAAKAKDFLTSVEVRIPRDTNTGSLVFHYQRIEIDGDGDQTEVGPEQTFAIRVADLAGQQFQIEDGVVGKFDRLAPLLVKIFEERGPAHMKQALADKRNADEAREKAREAAIKTAEDGMFGAQRPTPK